MTVRSELYAMAQKLKITGRSKMTNDELREAVAEANAEPAKDNYVTRRRRILRGE